ncbi:hypothetical protein RFI_31293, partial [Reticulomyxa filosa]
MPNESAHVSLSWQGHILEPSNMALVLNDMNNNYSEIQVNLHLKGGKGGFGSLLRAAGKMTKTTNKSAMRDLSGRRVRYNRQEQELGTWLEEQKTNQNANDHNKKKRELQKDFAHIKQYGQPRETRMCHKGVHCPYQWKCKFRHPGDDEREHANKKQDAARAK